MEAKEIVAQMGNLKSELEGDVASLKSAVEQILEKRLLEAKTIAGEVPTKSAFLAVLAELIDQAIVLPQPAESFDGLAISFILQNLDKYVLDKWFGDDWYEKIVAKLG